ncbi:beta-barrel assembly-enhancing protease [Rhodocyclaceae bacterium SMB388]
MIKRLFVLLLCAALASTSAAIDLPDLGDVATSDLSPLAERQIGEQIMQQIRWRDPDYLDDREIEGYINRLGRRLAAASDHSEDDFEFFVIRDSTLNAFALPGGYIGLHSGLILNAESESELASVLGHEMAHVTQRHIAQLFGRQGQSTMIVLASLLVAILAARSDSQFSQAALATGQAGAIQSQIGYTRMLEREADRIGLQILDGAGMDVRGMPSFFERLQRSTRIYENNAPSYLRTHPLTQERISDMGNRVAQMRYRQVPDSSDFNFVRTKLRVTAGTPVDVLRDYETRIAAGEQDQFVRYGHARALLRAGKVPEALKAVESLRQDARPSAFIDGLAAETMLAAGEAAGAAKMLEVSVKRDPEHASLRYLLIEAMIQSGRVPEAATLARDHAVRAARDPHYWALSSRAEQALGRMSAYHRAQAEVYVLRGTLPAAIEQLELARQAGDGDFYELSAIDARMRALKAEEAERRREQR